MKALANKHSLRFVKGIWKKVVGTTERCLEKEELAALELEFASARKTAPKVAATGQLHHPISIPIAQALKDHPTLKALAWRRGEFTTRAINEAAHKGYGRFFREVDAEGNKRK